MPLRRALAPIMLLAAMLTGCSLLYPTPDGVLWEPLPTVQVEAMASVQPTASPTEIPPATSAPTLDSASLAQETAAKAAWARDVVWAYLVQALEASELPAIPTWAVGEVARSGDATHYRYVSDTWVVTISVPAGPLDEAICGASLVGPADFNWTAHVDTQGNVQGEVPVYTTPTPPATPTLAATETPTPTPTQPLVPTATAAPTSTLTPTPVATLVPASELVEGWVGQIGTVDAEPRYDDYFVLEGTGARYGIASLTPRIAEELASYRDPGTRLRVWGMLDYGIDDYSGRRIVVGRYEVVN